MSSDENEKVRNIFDEVVDLPAEERDARLEELCGNNLNLRHKVERMIVAHHHDNDSLPRPGQIVAEGIGLAKPLNGQTIDHFRILDLIGEGGMGQIYEAEDLRLSRRVAIKFLPAGLSRRSELTRLFQNEGRIAAGLKHPNIVTIHDVGNKDGYHFIVMELIKGITLRQHLQERKRLEVDEVCRLSTQILSAIRRAHHAGIFHCDIKPENVMLEESDPADGTGNNVKVLDFGLARFGMALSKEESSHQRGTPEYTSPEQKKGSSVDARSDIFSFGVMLHEMVYGIRPAKVVARAADVPEELAGIIRRCIAESPDERFQTASELLAAINSFSSNIRRRRFPVHVFKRQEVVTTMMLCLLAAVTVGVIALIPTSSIKSNIVTPVTEITPSQWADLTPDGKQIVFDQESKGLRSIWVFDRRVNAKRQIIEPRDARYRWPTISNDGRYLYLVRTKDGAGGTPNVLIRVPMAGGPVETITSGIGSPIGLSPDGQSYAHVVENLPQGYSDLRVGRFDGSKEKVLISRRVPSAYTLDGPVWSPDGKTIATTFCNENNGIYFDAVGIDVETLHERTLTGRRWGHILGIKWLPDSARLIIHAKEKGSDPRHQLYLVDPDSQDQPKPIDSGVDYRGRPGFSTDSGEILSVYGDTKTSFWVNSPLLPEKFFPVETGLSSDSTMDGYEGVDWLGSGQLVYTSRQNRYENISVADLKGNVRQITASPSNNRYPAGSVDGRYVVFSSDRTGQSHIFRMDSDGSNQIELTKGFNDMDPQISPDGKWVVFTSVDSSMRTIWRVSINGGTPEKLADGWAESPAISPDGRWIAYITDACPFQKECIAVKSVDVNVNKQVRLLDIPAPTYPRYRYFRWSPDSRAIDYVLVENGVGNLWRRPIGEGLATQLTDFRDLSIQGFRWSGDGKRLLVNRLDNRLKLHLIKCEECPRQSKPGQNLGIGLHPFRWSKSYYYPSAYSSSAGLSYSEW